MSDKRAVLSIGYKHWLMSEHDAIAIAKIFAEAQPLDSAFDSLSGFELIKRSHKEMPQVKFLDFPAIAELELGSD